MREIWKNKSLESLPGEIWVNIPGYPDCFFVSNMGRVKKGFWVKGRSRKERRNSVAHFQEKILTQHLNKKGYPRVDICLGNKEKLSRTVHRLVAAAFLGPAPGGFDQVNHKKGIKTDNKATELEWSNNSHNIKHAWETGLFNPVLPKGVEFGRAKPVLHKEYGIFCTIIEAARMEGVTRRRMADMVTGKIINTTKFIAA